MSSSAIIYGILIALVASIQISMIAGASPPEKSCKAVFNELNRLQMRQISICANKLGYKTGREKVKKSSCILKCVLTTGGLINADGSAPVDKFEEYIEQHFPASLHSKARATFSPCLNLIGATAVQSTPANDEYCKAHEPFIKCMSKNFMKLCQSAKIQARSFVNDLFP